MAYTKTIWADDTVPDIDADNLNKMEQGIFDANQGFSLGSAENETILKLSGKSGYYQNIPYTQTNGKVVNVSAANVATVASLSTARYRVASVTSGDFIRCSSKALTGYNSFIFTDNSDNVISVIPFKSSQTQGTAYEFCAVVPDGATKIYCNIRGAFASSLQKVWFYNTPNANDVSLIPSLADAAYYTGSFTNLTAREDSPGSGYTATINADNTVTASASSNYRTNVYDVTEGKIYQLYKRVNNAPSAPTIFTDNSNNLIGVIEHGEIHADYKYVVKVPAGATKLWNVSYATTPRCAEYNGSSAAEKVALINIAVRGKPTFAGFYSSTTNSVVTVNLPSNDMSCVGYYGEIVSTISNAYTPRSFDIPSGYALIWDVENDSLSVVPNDAVPRSAIVLLFQVYGKVKGGAFWEYFNEFDGEGLRNLEYYTGELWEYNKDYCQTKLAECRAKSLGIGSTGDVFVFVSDTHNKDHNQSQDSPRLIGNIAKGMYIDKVIFGGDMVYAYDPGGYDEMIYEMWVQIEAYQKWVSPWAKVYNVIGNHDIHINTASSGGEHIELTADEVYSALFREQESRIVQNPNDILGMYYYFDRPAKKMRYVCLNSQLDGTQMTNQATWLSSIMETTPEDYLFVIISHVPMIQSQSADYYWNASLYEIIKTYATRVVGIFAGHVHADAMEVKDGIVHVAILADARVGAHNYGGRTYEAGAFDVNFIDVENSRVDLIRVGAGSNRAFIFGENPEIIDLSAE